MTDTSPVWERVRGIVPVSLCDWPGRVSCVLFTCGCNLRCPTCHNSSLAWDWEQLPSLDRAHVLADLRGRRHWLDGVTVSGGEPTCLAGLDELLADLAETGLPVKLDSNGSAPAVLARLLRDNLVQSLAIDVKGPWRMYPRLTGHAMTADDAKASLEEAFCLAQQYPGRVYFRCTKVPDLSPSDLEETQSQVPTGLPLSLQEFVVPQGSETFPHNLKPDFRSEYPCLSR